MLATPLLREPQSHKVLESSLALSYLLQPYLVLTYSLQGSGISTDLSKGLVLRSWSSGVPATYGCKEAWSVFTSWADC